jgi:hypothetical protein
MNKKRQKVMHFARSKNSEIQMRNVHNARHEGQRFSHRRSNLPENHPRKKRKQEIEPLKQVISSLLRQLQSRKKPKFIAFPQCYYCLPRNLKVNCPNPKDIFHIFIKSKIDRNLRFHEYLRVFKRLDLHITKFIFKNWVEVKDLILESMGNLISVNITIGKGVCKYPPHFKTFLSQLLTNSNDTLIFMKIPTFFIPPHPTLPNVEEICFYANKDIVLSKDFTTYLGTLYLRLQNLRIVSVENVETRLEHFVNL